MKKVKKDYKYLESGLDNVKLINFAVYECDCGEEIPIIPNIEGVHNLIGLMIVKSKRLLLGQQIKYLRKELGLKAVDLAKLLGVYRVTVSRWETGKESIGTANDRLIRVLFIRKLERVCKQYSDIRPIFKNISLKSRKVSRIDISANRLKRPCLSL
jgi:putative zinc finger/helix-turn-helix YgiT family protein